MLCGRPPHYQSNRKQMLQDIVTKPIEMKEHFSAEARSLLSGLLERDPKKRLGSSTADASDIMAHAFFRDINWQDLREKRIKAPYTPHTTSPEDCRNIDLMFLSEKPKESPSMPVTIDVKNKTAFAGFTYNVDVLQR